MRHVIIASHHRFADGLKDTLEFIGGVQNMRAVCAYVDDTPLVLSDILQGSVNQAFVPYLGEHVFVVSGVNVACCLELALSADELTTAFIEEAIAQARQAMVLVNTYATDSDDEDE